jgi:solute carrier family 35 protein E1
MPSSSRNNGGSLHVPLCFALWYALNVAYNVTNKWALNGVQDYVAVMNTAASSSSGSSSALPLTIGCVQFGVGAAYSIALWAFGMRRPVPHAAELSSLASRVVGWASRRRRCRGVGGSPGGTPPPRIDPPYPSSSSASGLRGTLRIAVHHTLGQLCTVLCLSSNSVGFAHVVKAAEPLFSALASRTVLGQRMDVRVYLSLLPVVGGVVMACAGSDEFSWTGFIYGMGSNAFFAMRGVVSKMVMDAQSSSSLAKGERPANVVYGRTDRDDDADDDDVDVVVEDSKLLGGVGSEGERAPPAGLSPANLFAAVTCASFVLSVPLALAFEGGILREIFRVAAAGGGGEAAIFACVVSSGLFHYLNNEVMYLVLSNVHPITLAVGNTAKRVFIIAAGVLVFATPVSLQTAIGSAIAIGGVFVYSLMQQWYGSAGGSYQGSGDAGACCGAKIH